MKTLIEIEFYDGSKIFVDENIEIAFGSIQAEHKKAIVKINGQLAHTYLMSKNEIEKELERISKSQCSNNVYPMTYSQPCQLDCRMQSCINYEGAGICSNISPAITLNENNTFVCWTFTEKH